MIRIEIQEEIPIYVCVCVCVCVCVIFHLKSASWYVGTETTKQQRCYVNCERKQGWNQEVLAMITKQNKSAGSLE